MEGLHVGQATPRLPHERQRVGRQPAVVGTAEVPLQLLHRRAEPVISRGGADCPPPLPVRLGQTVAIELL